MEDARGIQFSFLFCHRLLREKLLIKNQIETTQSIKLTLWNADEINRIVFFILKKKIVICLNGSCAFRLKLNDLRSAPLRDRIRFGGPFPHGLGGGVMKKLMWRD